MKIVVLAGGTSTERDVSFVSGSMVYKALKSKGHEVILADVFCGLDPELVESIAGQDYDLSGLFYADRDWAAEVKKIGEECPDLESVIKNRPPSEDGYFGPFVLEICRLADMVFLGLHGENGENGKVQAAFDLLGIRYTGTDYASSAIAMNKTLSKSIFKVKGIPTPEYFIIQPIRQEEEIKSGSIRKPLKYPCVVKTACGGSSVGVYIAKDEAEYLDAVRKAAVFKADILIEEYIKGREFSVGVVDGEAYPIIEIAPISGFYDYKNKYQAGSTVETCPARLPWEITAAIQKTAEDAYAALGMSGYGRMDFMMDENNRFYCLEANTLPGMTPTSLLPQEAAARGEDFAQLCEKIVHVSLRRYLQEEFL
ncbi:MAG: D-alanine--D-alanine ligase [Lachnospiraceae bacterium]|nr:D-alanine--D-alanine ligase [Lachnospiraceae bacterium]